MGVRAHKKEEYENRPKDEVCEICGNGLLFLGTCDSVTVGGCHAMSRVPRASSRPPPGCP